MHKKRRAECCEHPKRLKLKNVSHKDLQLYLNYNTITVSYKAVNFQKVA